MKKLIIAGILLALLTAGTTYAYGGEVMAFSIKSADFKDGGTIPKRFSCDGDDISPELSWAEPPAGTKSFAMIVEDPDAPKGTFIHWIIYDIPADWKALKRGMTSNDGIEHGVKQGQTDFGNPGWGGPCPPKGYGRHRYIFTLKALDLPTLGLSNDAKKLAFDKALQGHVLGEAKILGVYDR